MSVIGRTGANKKSGLNIEIKDFGPIIKGRISLKPLTLFIGPNNSGKSYVAMLIHSIYETYAPTISLRDAPQHYPREFSLISDIGLSTIEKDFAAEHVKLKEQISNLKDGEELEIPESLLNKVTNNILNGVYGQMLRKEVLRSYASPLDELIRIGEESFAWKIDFDSDDVHIIYENKQLIIKKYPKLDIKIKVEAVEGVERELVISGEEYETIISPDRIEFKEDKTLLQSILLDAIATICARYILKKAAVPCYYLPAGRSGILQGRKLLTRSIVDDYSLAGIEKFPTFAGVVSKFLTFVTDMPEREGTFYPLAKEFEDELIKGEIVVRIVDDHLYPEIRYRYYGAEIPLHRASSTVSELAPLFLYLKYIIEPGSILIIEEPEAHLHPANQRILAKYLVRLIRNGVYIIITTHSEYLLEQLSNFIMLSKIEPKKRAEKYGYAEDDYLARDELAAYVFNLDKTGIGSRIAEVEITEEDGISQEEFLKVHEVLYDEVLRLERDLDGDM